MSSLKRLIHEVHRRSLWQVLGIYLFGAWIGYEIIQSLTEGLGLPQWFPALAILLFIVGLPIVVATAFVREAAAPAQAPSEPAPEGEPPRIGVEAAARREAGRGRFLTARNAGLAFVGALALWGVVAIGWLALQQTVSAPPRSIRSLAVLPLADLSGDPDQEYFADGMTEALIGQLAQISALRVISRTSVMQYKDARKQMSEIARELNVDAVVEGTVLRAGDRVRITAQLVHAPTDRHLWADSYERDLGDILALQSEVARAIAQEIRAEVTADEQARLAGARPVERGAYEHYLRGRYLCERWTPEDMNRAIEYLQQAIEEDPGYAPARSELATCYVLLAFFGYLPPREAYPRARAAASAALEIDERLAEAHVALGAVAWYFEWNSQEAEREYRRAIELNPSNSVALYWYTWLLGETGRWDEGIAAVRRAQELDPISRSANTALKREYDQAIIESEKLLELDPNDAGAYYFLAWPYKQKGMYEEAIAMLEKAVTLSEGVPMYVAGLGHAYALAGRNNEALQILNQLQEQRTRMPPDPFHIALVYIGLGDKEEAFEWLEKAYQERSTQLVFLKVGPRFDSLRDDPRFQDLLRRMNFPM
jgi:TolB-like protein/Tfp pilus assembly protein PilF